MFTLVAVATRAEGFTTLAGLVPAFAFHGATSVGGMGLLEAARKREPVAAAEAA